MIDSAAQPKKERARNQFRDNNYTTSIIYHTVFKSTKVKALKHKASLLFTSQ